MKPMTTMDKNGTLWQSVAPSWVLGCAQTDTNLTDITDGLLFEFTGPRWWGKTPENAADWQDFSWFTKRVMLH